MEIEFKNKKLRRICEDYEIAIREIGQNSADKLKSRLMELLTFDLKYLLQYRVGGCHALTGNRKGQYAMYLDHPNRLIFKVKQTKTALIIEIVDYH